jgi:anaerobic selenocysteine-containing dehydrogenase
MEGRAIKSEGNPNHPVSRGKICSAGLTSVQGLYNPDRVRGPVRAEARGSGNYTSATWDEGIEAVRGALAGSPGGIAFLLGMAPDHLYDLVGELTAGLGAPPPVRYGSLATFESRATLMRASEALFGVSAVPYFDLSTAEYVFAFGDILGQWLSPVAYGRLYGQMRQGDLTQRGYLVVFEPHQTLTGANADEWVAIVPGSEGVLAVALARLVAEQRGTLTPDLEVVDVAAASQASGVPEERIRSLAERFAGSTAPLAIPGAGSLAHANGLAAAQAILNLNVIANNLGTSGGLFLSAADPFQPAGGPAVDPGLPVPIGISEVAALVDRMNSGQVQVLFVHGTNPLFELPAGLGFAGALANVPLVISFASFPDETSRQADWILPDHTGLESWGYQRQPAGADRPTVSGMQPVVVPMYDTRSTVDVLLAASGTLP